MKDDASLLSSATADDARPYDAATITELEGLFGRPRLAELLAGLHREIDGRIEPPVWEREQLGKDAHALVSASGILGFTTPSQACA